MNIAKNLEDAAFHFPNRSAVLENERDVNYLKFAFADPILAAVI